LFGETLHQELTQVPRPAQNEHSLHDSTEDYPVNKLGAMYFEETSADYVYAHCYGLPLHSRAEVIRKAGTHATIDSDQHPKQRKSVACTTDLDEHWPSSANTAACYTVRARNGLINVLCEPSDPGTR